MAAITVGPAGDLIELGARWRRLEAESDGGFFRGWTYLGCLVHERYAGRAWLLAVQDDAGVDLALALLGRRNGALFLHETGDRVLDALFIEHNGLLIRRGADALVEPALRTAVARGASLALSGIDTAHLHAARRAGWLGSQHSRFAPAVDLASLDRPFIDTRSANTRAQIRRAERLYGSQLTLRRAETLGEAREFLAAMIPLHQARWQGRGQPGAFAAPAITRFHETLIDRAWERGEVDLLRIATPERVVGLLYNFVDRCAGHSRILSYQGGFAYSADKREKPGLVCHAMAIAFYAAEGRGVYDFLGGADRYKTSLASCGETLHWAVLRRRGSARGATGALLDWLRSRASSKTAWFRPAFRIPLVARARNALALRETP